ncbi:MAG TPA: hypothetical protein P5186_20740 [Candidatus Paceibacterota bacterium]|nr:hypothetical protein [Verrucomicrobiota bacterium]HRY50485.1 hypothetical protein [Candidatus Paceibacterota bacterium]HSA02491.1 hypothetical protein [Candidatus Paceibacterota bacterium]
MPLGEQPFSLSGFFRIAVRKADMQVRVMTDRGQWFEPEWVKSALGQDPLAQPVAT